MESINNNDKLSPLTSSVLTDLVLHRYDWFVYIMFNKEHLLINAIQHLDCHRTAFLLLTALRRVDLKKKYNVSRRHANNRNVLYSIVLQNIPRQERHFIQKVIRKITSRLDCHHIVQLAEEMQQRHV